VFHCHDTPVLRFAANRVAAGLDYPLCIWVTRATQRSRFSRRSIGAPLWLDKAGDPRAPLIVPNGAARDFYPSREDLERTGATAVGSKRVLYLGSMGPENGQPQALKRSAVLPCAFKLDMAGFGTAEFRRELSELAAALSLEARVSISDWVPDHERNRLAEQASVGLVLYRAVILNWEHSGPSPNKLFPIRAWGLPVVVPDRESFPRVFCERRMGELRRPRGSRGRSRGRSSCPWPIAIAMSRCRARRDARTKRNTTTSACLRRCSRKFVPSSGPRMMHPSSVTPDEASQV